MSLICAFLKLVTLRTGNEIFVLEEIRIKTGSRK